MEQLAPYYNSDSLQLGRPHEKTITCENKHQRCVRAKRTLTLVNFRRRVGQIFSQVGYLFCCPDAPAAFLVPCKRTGQIPLSLLSNILRMLQVSTFPSI